MAIKLYKGDLPAGMDFGATVAVDTETMGLLPRRDKLCEGLADVGFEVLTPAGTYFAQTDIRPLGWDDDFEFCRMLPREVGVAAIPTSAFYGDRDAGKHLVRWAFCKTDAVLDEGLARLKKLKDLRR